MEDGGDGGDDGGKLGDELSGVKEVEVIKISEQVEVEAVVQLVQGDHWPQSVIYHPSLNFCLSLTARVVC